MTLPTPERYIILDQIKQFTQNEKCGQWANPHKSIACVCACVCCAVLIVVDA